MDECMEILFRRFGKGQLEARVNEFMANDEVRCAPQALTCTSAGTGRERRGAARIACACLCLASPFSPSRAAQDGDKDISITEFLKMDQKNDLAGTSKHPGFRLSAGMLATTKEENKRLLRQMGIASK